jgi:hypothetical protein
MDVQLHRDFLLHRDHVPWSTFSGGGGVCSTCRRTAKVSPQKIPAKALKKAEKEIEKAEQSIEKAEEIVEDIVSNKLQMGLLPPLLPSPLRARVPNLQRLEEELPTSLPIGSVIVHYEDIDTDAGLMVALTHDVPRHRYSSNTIINAKQTLEEYAQTKYGKPYEKITKSEKAYLIALYRLNHFGKKK